MQCCGVVVLWCCSLLFRIGGGGVGMTSMEGLMCEIALNSNRTGV